MKKPSSALEAAKKKAAPKSAVRALLAAIERADLPEVLRLAEDGVNGDIDGKRPLSAAAGRGALAMLEALLPHCDMRAEKKDSWRYSALMNAVDSGSLECVQFLLPLSDPGFVTDAGETALMVAARRPSADVLNLLLPLSAPRAVDQKRQTALMLAAKRGNIESVKALLPVSDVNGQDADGMTALMHAFVPYEFRNTQPWQREANARCVEALIPFADSNIRDALGNTALMKVAAGGNDVVAFDVLEMLINSSDAGLTNDDRESALTLAAMSRCEEYVQALLPVSDANLQNASGDTALAIAARHGDATTVRILEAATDVNLRNGRGKSALMNCLDAHAEVAKFSGSIGHLRCALRLLSQSDVDAQDDHGESALMKAMQIPLLEVFEMMLPRANVNLQDAEGHTALMLANHLQKSAFFDLLLPLADADMQDSRGRTALMKAATHLDVSQGLLARSNPDIQDCEGFSALMLAADSGATKTVSLLLEVADARLINREGKTARDLALRSKHVDLARQIEAVELIQREKAELKKLLPEGTQKAKPERRVPRETGL